MTAGRSRLRSSIVVPVLFALAAVATFLLLGTWQLQRKAWKEGLIKTMSERISAAPIDLPARALWPYLDAENIVINRGFVPDARRDVVKDAEPSSNVAVVSGVVLGVMRWPQAAGYFTPKDDPDHNLWFVRDHLAIAAGKGWGEVAPFYVDLESPVPPGGLPSPATPTVQLRNEHLQYAITWYGLAAVVSIMFGYWLATHRRGERAAASL
jgi:cytochrome oxidase assembly protein ShyY1